MRIKRGISLLLMLSLVLTSLVGLTGEQVQAEPKPAPMGEVVYAHFGYHDTWTTQWIGKGDLATEEGKTLSSNLSISWDKGAPKSSQTSEITLSAAAFNVSNAEEFKNQYKVVPLQPAALMSFGYSAEQADKIIADTLARNASIPAGEPSMGTSLDPFIEKYVDKGVTNYSINNNGINSSGDNIKIPMSYALSGPNTDFWGEDLTEMVGNAYSGLPARVATYKAEGRTYAEFRTWVLQYYVMPESSLQHLWNNGYLASGTVGWRWYIPFAVIRVGQPGDLNVPDLSITVDNGGDITCEATVENSFTDNLKRVQFVWELETPAGTVIYKLTE